MSRSAGTLPFAVGDAVYLTPRTLGAASVTWKQPKCVIAAIHAPNITVRLNNGQEVTTHEDNVVRRLPTAPRKTKSTHRPATPELPSEYDEIPLFGMAG